MFIVEMQARGSIWRCLRKPEVTGNELRVAGNWNRQDGLSQDMSLSESLCLGQKLKGQEND